MLVRQKPLECKTGVASSAAPENSTIEVIAILIPPQVQLLMIWFQGLMVVLIVAFLFASFLFSYRLFPQPSHQTQTPTRYTIPYRKTFHSLRQSPLS